MDIKNAISQASDDLKRAIANSGTAPKTVIARYTAAFAVNFTDWIGKTRLYARHEWTKYALDDNMRCEATQDHVGMLLAFAKRSSAMPGPEDYEHVATNVALVRSVFASEHTAGLVGVVILATLEKTSEIFIPDLAQKAKACGCTNFQYTDVHGTADVEHSQAFLKAVQEESHMGYKYPDDNIRSGINLAQELILKIYR